MTDSDNLAAALPREKASISRLTLRILGSGLLFAATSVGASHLVQSTRAGALFRLPVCLERNNEKFRLEAQL